MNATPHAPRTSCTPCIPLGRALALAVALPLVATAPPASARLEVLAADAAHAAPDAAFPWDSGLVAESMRYEYRCSPTADGIATEVVEHLVVANPSAREVSAIGLAHGVWGDGATALTIDGAPAERATFGPAEGHAFDCAHHVAVMREAVDRCPEGGDWQGLAFRFTVAPGGRRELVFTTAHRVVGSYDDGDDSGLGWDANVARHPFLHGDFYAGATAELTTEVDRELTLRGDPPITVTIETPPGWSLVGRDDPVEVREAGGHLVATLATSRAALEARRLPDPPDPSGITPPGLHHLGPFLVTVYVERPGHDVVANGGPFIGLGARVGSDDDRFRARFGYEVALLSHAVLAAITADIDSAGDVTIAPLIGVAAPFVPTLLLAPSVGIAAGPAFALGPDSRVGLRAVATATYPLLGVDVSMDYFPASGASDSELVWAVLGRIGF